MMFVIPVLLPFYRDQMGLSFNDFLLGEAFFAATVVLLDVPTGWLSDQWQRKHILALASLLDLAGFIVLLNAHGLVQAVLAQILLGVGISLMSGTNSAMLYESLMSAGREDEYRKIEGRRGGIGLYSVAGASIIGGLLYPHHHQLPILLSAVMQVVAIMIACLTDEPERHRKRPEKHPVLDIIETTRYALSHPEVGLILIFAAIMFCSTKMIMWAQQPYYMAMHLNESFYGILMAGGFALGGFSSHMAHKLDGKVSTIKALALAWIGAVGACIGAASHLGWPGVSLLMIGGTCIYGMASPRVTEAINRHVGSERRATILSTQSLLTSLLFIPLSRLMGHISDAYGVQAVLLAVALWLGIAGLCLAGWQWRRSVLIRRVA
jgi:MFS family permease